jgi:hypothetical protein
MMILRPLKEFCSESACICNNHPIGRARNEAKNLAQRNYCEIFGQVAKSADAIRMKFDHPESGLGIIVPKEEWFVGVFDPEVVDPD